MCQCANVPVCRWKRSVILRKNPINLLRIHLRNLWNLRETNCEAIAEGDLRNLSIKRFNQQNKSSINQRRHKNPLSRIVPAGINIKGKESGI